MTERKYIWYIEPLDDSTNQTVSQELPIENFCHAIRCGDGKKHNLWRCEFSLASSMHKSKESLNLNFNIFGREGNGKIRRCPPFVFTKKKKRKKKQEAGH